MPLGSSSDAPVIRPGPSTRRRRGFDGLTAAVKPSRSSASAGSGSEGVRAFILVASHPEGWGMGPQLDRTGDLEGGVQVVSVRAVAAAQAFQPARLPAF